MSLTQLKLCKEAPYFGAEGLTSTSANFIANKAKEMYDGMDKDLTNVNFLHKDYKVIDKEAFRVTASSDETVFETIKTNLKQIGKLKALIAWLREGIKLKSDTSDFLKRYTLQEYVEDVLELQPIKMPVAKKIDEDALSKEFGYDRLQRALELQAQAACVGHYIHKNGSISKARKEFNDLKNKTIVKGEGTETTFITYVAAISGESLEKNYLELQELQRKYQAELNGIRHEIDLKIEDAKKEAAIEYKDAMIEYNKAINEYNIKFNEWLREETSKVSELKIVIPESLKEIYSVVKNA